MSLKDFCAGIPSDIQAYDKIDPEIIGREFVKFFSLPKIISLGRLKALAKSLGIEKIYPEELPESYRGYHFGSNHRYEIQYRKGDWVGSIEHTVFHEIYEIIEETLGELSVEFDKRKGEALERAADAFAASVLMQTEHFLTDVYDQSLDVIRLQKEYGRAYSSIIIRMKRVLNNRQSFFAVIYEPKTRDRVYVNEYGEINHAHLIEDFVCTYSVKTSDIKPNKHHGRLLWCTLPRKKSCILFSSVAHHVLTNERSVFRESATGFDMFGQDDISIIARPVFWNHEIAKVVVVGVPRKDSRLIRGQIRNINPLMLHEVFQII